MSPIENGDKIRIVFADATQPNLIATFRSKNDGLWYIHPLTWVRSAGELFEFSPRDYTLAINPLSSNILYIGKE